MRCDDLTDALAAVADGGAPLDLAGRRHVDSCLRCQAELTQYRKLLKALRTLRTEVLEPAPGFVTEVLASLEAAGERHALRSLARGRTAAYVGGIAVATAAGAGAAAIVWATRSRRLARSA